MKKFAVAVAITLVASTASFAGGLNQAATDEVVEAAPAKRVGSGGGALGIALAVLVLGGVAAAGSTSGTN